MTYTSTFGATLIVAGLALGAGMLGMPLASSQVGLLPGLALLVFFWFITNASAFILVELNQRLGATLSIPGLCRAYLGRWGGWVATAALAGLHVAVLSAYITGVSDMLRPHLSDWPPHLIPVVFTAVMATLIRYSRRLTDYSNRAFFIGKVVAFGGLIILLLPYVSLSQIGAGASASSFKMTHIWMVLPVYFASFGFHGSLHSVMVHAGLHNVQQIRRVFWSGSLMALVAYMLWLAATLGVNPAPSKDVPEFLAHVNQVSCHTSFLTILSETFAFCALLTSFLGVGLGQFDFVREYKDDNRIATYLTFVPPLGFALFYPEGFLLALSYAGVCLSVLALVLPSIMALQQWRQPFKDRAPGGVFLRGLLLLVGLAIMAARWLG